MVCGRSPDRFPGERGLTAAQWVARMFQVDPFAVVLWAPNAIGCADVALAGIVAVALRGAVSKARGDTPPPPPWAPTESDNYEGDRRVLAWPGGASDRP